MMAAPILSQQLSGHWCSRDGAAPCPVCQANQHKTQNAIIISDGVKYFFANCKKTGSLREITVAAELTQGTLAEYYLRKRGITCELQNTLRSFHDKTDFTDKTKCHTKSVENVRDVLGLAA
jgi:hypothetical protein